MTKNSIALCLSLVLVMGAAHGAATEAVGAPPAGSPSAGAVVRSEASAAEPTLVALNDGPGLLKKARKEVPLLDDLLRAETKEAFAPLFVKYVANPYIVAYYMVTMIADDDCQFALHLSYQQALTSKLESLGFSDDEFLKLEGKIRSQQKAAPLEMDYSARSSDAPQKTIAHSSRASYTSADEKVATELLTDILGDSSSPIRTLLSTGDRGAFINHRLSQPIAEIEETVSTVKKDYGPRISQAFRNALYDHFEDVWSISTSLT